MSGAGCNRHAATASRHRNVAMATEGTRSWKDIWLQSQTTRSPDTILAPCIRAARVGGQSLFILEVLIQSLSKECEEMPSSPRVADRTWFGVARCTDVVQIEGAIEPWSDAHDFAELLIIDDRGPVDWLLLSPDHLNEHSVQKHLAQSVETDDRPHLPPVHDGTLTIAICTRERPDSIETSLASRGSVAQCMTVHEVIVVDNALLTNATKLLVDRMDSAGMWIRRTVEPLNRASLGRDTLRGKQHSFVVFTDDDADPIRAAA